VTASGQLRLVARAASRRGGVATVRYPSARKQLSRNPSRGIARWGTTASECGKDVVLFLAARHLRLDLAIRL